MAHVGAVVIKKLPRIPNQLMEKGRRQKDVNDLMIITRNITMSTNLRWNEKIHFMNWSDSIDRRPIVQSIEPGCPLR